jgi:putative FmdB family regulatory protein
MPIYEYKCKACNREFEYQQRMSDPDKTECEACGASALERLISATAFHLKGGGWYKDLYASSKPEAKSSSESTTPSSSSSDSGSSSSSSSDSSSSSSGTSSTSGTSGGGSGSGSKAAASAS